MTKGEWYRDRILWRASKHNIESCFWENFSLSHEEQAKHLLSAIAPYGEPLLIFWKEDGLWTIVTERFLLGSISSRVVAIELDHIEKKIVPISVAGENINTSSDILTVGNEGLKFWAPTGNCLFALWNILKMFPLSHA